MELLDIMQERFYFFCFFFAYTIKTGISKNPDVIGVDAGSSDGGPAFLGSGTSLTDEKAVKRDLEFVLADAINRKIPFIIGSAGTSGGEPHIAREVRLIKEVAKEKLGLVDPDEILLKPANVD